MRPSARLFLSLLLPLAPLAAQEKFTLRYAFEPGQVTWTRRTVERTPASDPSIKLAFSIWNECKVVDVRDGIASIDCRCARVTIKIAAVSDELDYDSDAGVALPPDGWPRTLAELVGKTAKLRVDTTGKVLERTLPDGFEKRLEQGAPPNVSLHPEFVVLPTNPVAIGETWKGEISMPMRSKANSMVNVSNKLTGVRENIATIEQSLVSAAPNENTGSRKREVVTGGGTTRIGLCNLVPVEGAIDIAQAGDRLTTLLHLTTKQVPPPKQAVEAPEKEEPKKRDGK